ncbi:MAG: hypothetical protein V3T86_08960 [Planctomycetota bacterium]
MNSIRVCLLVLLCSVPSVRAEDQEPSPLAFLEPLIGGHWLTDARLPGGEPIRTRVTYRYGFAKQFVRGRVYTLTDKGDYLTYETLFFFDPEKKHVAALTFSAQGAISRGVARPGKPGMIEMRTPRSANLPMMRQEYAFTPGVTDAYTGRNYFDRGGAWVQVMETKSKRRADPPIGKPLRLREPSEWLRPLVRLIGGRWEITGTMGGRELDGFTRYEWSLHPTVIESKTVMRNPGPEHTVYVAFQYFDPAAKRLRFLSFSPTGMKVAVVTVRPDVLHYEYTEHTAAGPVRYKEEHRFLDDDTIKWKVNKLDGKNWVEFASDMTARRVRD